MVRDRRGGDACVRVVSPGAMMYKYVFCMMSRGVGCGDVRCG